MSAGGWAGAAPDTRLGPMAPNSEKLDRLEGGTEGGRVSRRPGEAVTAKGWEKAGGGMEMGCASGASQGSNRIHLSIVPSPSRDRGASSSLTTLRDQVIPAHLVFPAPLLNDENLVPAEPAVPLAPRGGVRRASE